MRYKAKQLSNGKWAAFFGERYFPHTTSDTEKEAKIEALYMTGYWHNRKIDEVQNALEELGLVNERDPRGWLA